MTKQYNYKKSGSSNDSNDYHGKMVIKSDVTQSIIHAKIDKMYGKK